uniref:Uncharacterized protein LOC104244753 n=1 Tax=Nicotiana sylvestris TaxID=4096 RepID=A0A1U7YI81_NICSY
PVKYMLYALLV